MPRALASVPLPARLLVIDAQSTDETIALAGERQAQVIVRPWAGFVSTRRFALASVRTPWTFMLDADEALDAEAARALGAAQPEADTNGYTLARHTYFCERRIRGGGWGGEAPLRLFRTAVARLAAHPAAGGVAELHESWNVPGRIDHLTGTLHHYSYPTLASYRSKFSRYTALEASGLQASRARFARALAIAAGRAPWLFFARGGWRDGWRGAFIALASAAYPLAVAWKALRP